MNRQILFDHTVSKIRRLPDMKLKEVNDFVDFLSSKLDAQIILQGIQKITTESFEFLSKEEDIYSVDDLKEKYK